MELIGFPYYEVFSDFHIQKTWIVTHIEFFSFLNLNTVEGGGVVVTLYSTNVEKVTDIVEIADFLV